MLAHRATTRAWMLLSAARCIALLGLVAMLGCSAYAGVALEERQLPARIRRDWFQTIQPPRAELRASSTAEGWNG
jgi:hypothetical protein